MQEKSPSLDTLVQICREQLRLAQDASTSPLELARLLERKDEVIGGIDFGQLGTDAQARVQAEEVVRLEGESLEALKRHRDATGAELRKLACAKAARDVYLRRKRGPGQAQFFDRAG